MIEYVEIRSAATRELEAIIDTADTVVWQSQYYGVGEFGIYVAATRENIAALRRGNYVTRPNNDEVGIIERIEIKTDENGFKMLDASGRFVKSLLNRRVVFSATIDGVGNDYIWRVPINTLSGNVELAVRKLVSDNAVNPAITARAMNIIELNDADISHLPDIIVVKDSDNKDTAADKQTELQNLLEYSDGLLEEYSMGATMYLDYGTYNFRYKVYRGRDLSVDNTEGNEPLIFSQEFDNLLTSEYAEDDTSYKNTAIIGGEGEGIDRYYAFANASNAGLARRETFINASGIKREYEDAEDQKQTYTLEVYRKMLEAQGSQTLGALKLSSTFIGEADLTRSALVYGVDYKLGDLVTVEDKDLGIYVNVRIVGVTETQDEDGYKIEIEFGN